MPHSWDADSPQLHDNLQRVLLRIEVEARNRDAWNSNSLRQWHIEVMRNLDAPDATIGKFRGEPGLENSDVRVGVHHGVRAASVFAITPTAKRRIR